MAGATVLGGRRGGGKRQPLKERWLDMTAPFHVRPLHSVSLALPYFTGPLSHSPAIGQQAKTAGEQWPIILRPNASPRIEPE
ncbi:hypothetical protein PM082_011956 [Marasmius tenuissimus]|nr:hypothetical protein PM082_011956 [Marasmius tenuissimus]